MIKKPLYIGRIWVVFLFLLSGCFLFEKEKVQTSEEQEKHLIIYCENSIAPLLQDLKPLFEKKFNCKIKLINDCSQNLIGLINFSEQGDLFIPDSYKAISLLRDKSDINIIDSIFIGYNNLALLVPNDNPNMISGNLSQLADSGISIIIANPETSSLGYSTKELLNSHSNDSNALFDQVIKNVVSLSIDSKGMAKSIANGDADVAISWISEMYQAENKTLIDSVLIAQEYSSEVYAGILSCTQNPILAKYFIDFVSSNEGSSVTKKYGLQKRKSLIF